MTGKNKRKCITAALLTMLLTASSSSAVITQAAERPSAVSMERNNLRPMHNRMASALLAEASEQAEDTAEQVESKEEELMNCMAQGTCGEQLTWTLSEYGVLTISGEGNMMHYKAQNDSDGEAAPWSKYGPQVTEIVIQDGVRTIGDYAFACCDNVKKLTIPNSVKNTYGQQLAGIEDTVEHLVIGGDLYQREIALNGWGKDTLQTVELLDGVTSIKSHDFFGYKKLTTLILPSSVKSIGQSAFSSCSSLKTVTLSEGLETIGNSAFANLTNLESICLPNSVETLGEGVFSGCTGLSSVVFPENLSIIPNDMFRYCSALDTIKIPTSVEKIGNGAFHSCTALLAIAIPDSVTTIGKEAFASCTGLSGTFVIPNNVISLGEGAFRQCKGLDEVHLSTQLLEIEDFTFDSCKNLKVVTIPSGVEKIGNNAFSGCSSLNLLSIPDSVASIGSEAFAETALATIVIPDRVVKIGSSAFASCENLTSALLSQNLTAIEDDLFYGCSSLGTVEIPASVSKIGDRAFAYTGITSAVIPDHVSAIGKEAFRCSRLSQITIPDSVTSIGKGAFANTFLSGITLPKRLGEISDETFYNCTRLSEVRIPSKVTKIGNDAFTQCKTLQAIYFEGDLPKAEERALQGLTLCVYYPKLGTTTPSTSYGDAAEITWIKTAGAEQNPIVQKPIENATISVENQHFTGSELTPAVQVFEENALLEEGVDYTVAYENNTAIGTATVVVTGIGNYTGTASASFEIESYSAEEIAVSSIESQTYTGSAIEPKLELHYDSILLEEGTDYDLAYSDNENIGTASVRITFKGIYSGEKIVNFAINPTPITGLTADTSMDSVQLSWEKGAYADGYLVYRYDAEKDSWIKLKTTDKRTYVDDTCAAGMTYRYQVKAYTVVGEARYEAEAAVISATTVLEKPTGLGVSSTGENTISLKWNKVNGADGYYVYRKTAEDTKWTLLDATDTLVYTDEALASGTAYQYAVRPYKDVDSVEHLGNYTTIQTATTPAGATGLKAKVHIDSVDLRWDSVEGATGYSIYRWDDSKNAWKKLKTTNQLSYTDSDLKKNASYRYAIKAYAEIDGTVYGSKSVSVTVKTNSMQVPSIGVVANEDGTVILQWKNTEGADGYRVYRWNAEAKKWDYFLTTKELSCVDTNAIDSAANCYAVCAYANVENGFVYSDPAKSKEVVPVNMTAPVLRSVAKSTEDGMESVTATWDAVVGADYTVLRKTTEGSFVAIASVTAKSDIGSYVDTDVQSDVAYTYTVCRTQQTGKKVVSGAYDTDGITTITAKPTVWVDTNNTDAVISWEKTSDADGYAIFRKTDLDDDSWTEVAKVGADCDTYTDVYVDSFDEEEKSLLLSNRFMDPSTSGLVYTVTAYQEQDGKYTYSDYYEDGDFSLEAPSIVSVTSQEDVAEVTWGTVANAETYEIYSGSKDSSGNLVWNLEQTVPAESTVKQTVAIPLQNATHVTVKAVADKNGTKICSNCDTGFTIENRNYSDSNILFIGDSITFGSPYKSKSVREVFTYPWRVSQLTGASIYNPSIPGATYCYQPDDGSGDSRSRLVTDVAEKIRNGEVPEKALYDNTQTFEDFDVVVLAAGTNDYYYNSPMGTTDSTEITDFNGAVNTILQYITEGNVKRILSGKKPLKVVFVDLFYSDRCYGITERSSRFDTANALGYTLKDYQNSLYAQAEKYRSLGLEIYHFATDQIVTAENCGDTTSDNLHMSRFTYTQIGNQLTEYLIENNILS